MSKFLCKMYYNKVFKNKGDESLLPIIINNKTTKSNPYIGTSFYSEIPLFSICFDKLRRMVFIVIVRLVFLNLYHISRLKVIDKFEVGPRKNSTSKSS